MLADDRDLYTEANDHTPCVHCGCAFNVHKGGKPSDPRETRRKCPPLYAGRRGVPLAFPRAYPAEDATGDYSGYDQRIAAYWNTGAVFMGPCRDCGVCKHCVDRGLTR